MLVPSIFNDNFVDNFFDDMFRFPGLTSEYNRSGSGVMKTDIKDLGENYQLDIELPGFVKEDIHAELSKGYLTVTAQKTTENNEKEENGKYIRRERYSGSCRRSFHLGDNLKEEDIHASFENGMLKLVFPKEEQRRAVEEKKFIAIE